MQNAACDYAIQRILKDTTSLYKRGTYTADKTWRQWTGKTLKDVAIRLLGSTMQHFQPHTKDYRAKQCAKAMLHAPNINAFYHQS